MSIPIERTDDLCVALEGLFETVERDDGRIVCRSGAGTLEIEGHRVRGGMPLHSTELTDVTSIRIDAEAGEVHIENGSTSYTFRVPGAQSRPVF